MRAGLALVALLAVSACGGSLKLTKIDSSAQRPSNVAVYFTVDTHDGEPVAGLTADKFKIYEDDSPVSVLESKQTILNPEVSATHYTLLLVDMSGSVSSSDDVPVITQSASAFATRVEKFQKVAVYAFDGSTQIHPIAGFGSGGSATSGISRLSEYKPQDPSTNLNGAVIEGLKLLDQQMRASSTPLTFGTLVVFTDGTDRASRVKREQLDAALDKKNVDVMVIGVGAEIDGGELNAIGRDGAIVSKDRAQISASFDKMAARIEAMSKRYYLLGYCSPARAGKHVVRVETHAAGQGGSIEYEFNADGFTPNCDPNRPPNFDIRRPRGPRPGA
ncbi:MAG TPA: VWA domain-containing protein [Kofleriaceae bacterium]|jgi:hypothetical protein